MNSRIREAAARWHDRLTSGDGSVEVRAEFSRWLDELPEHRAAYSKVERSFHLAKVAGSVEPSILALRHEAALRIARRPRRRWRGSSIAAATIGMAILSVAIVSQRWTDLDGAWQWPSALRSILGSTPNAHMSRRYETAVGERLSFVLDDGTQVELNTDSILETDFVVNERRVKLKHGQAIFEVTKDASRPFVVEAFGRRFVAVGTAFDVRLDDDQVSVTMLEGTVRVERPSDAVHHSPVIATVTAGEQLTLERNHDESTRIALVDRIDRLTSWRRGQLIFENSRLGDAVKEVNRYSSTQIIFADKELADLRISGAFAVGRPTVFIEALTAYFPIEATRVDEHTMILGNQHKGPVAAE
jgi:transmembrane sensor